MNEKLGVIICKIFSEELKFIIKNNNIKNIEILESTPACIYGNIGQNEQLEAITSFQVTCNKIIIIGGKCCTSLNKMIIDSEKCKIHRLEYCSELFTNRDIIAHFISEKSYIVTPGWLKDWEKNIEMLGFDKGQVKIKFLDTGVCDDSLENLHKFSEYVNIPYDRIFVGLDFFRMFIEKTILEWRLECERMKSTLLLTNTNIQFADHTSAKQQLSYILNSIHEGVYIINSNFKAIFVNKAVENLVSLNDFRDIIGKSVFDVVPNEYREIVLERFKNILDNKVSAPLIEEKFIKYDGCIIDVEIYSGAIKYEGNWCILSVVRNISQRKTSENLKLKIAEQDKLIDDAMEYDKLRNDFFCNISHELRTPINVLLSALQLLNLDEINHPTIENKIKVKKYYKIMKQNSYRLLRLVNNLIDITKIDAGYFNLRLKNENIVAIIEDITMSVTSYAEHKGLELVFDTDTEDKIVVCDAAKIERIVLNILSNAIKFTPIGGTIFVSITEKDFGISVSIKDTGVGIPTDMKSSIFERFVQVDKSLSRDREGSGIGLSLVKSLVEMHGGTIRVESQYGSGSEFIIDLPEIGLPENQSFILDSNIAKVSDIEKLQIEFSDIYD
ncbi:PAS domain S-box protein [Clostridium estertheticum]|uniref:PAS domain-containing sensor histidine kinase n=1 Tax=Clostridium estertheticum TaxID=238834 RepID=UPI001C7D12D4|nr:PAS domain-containing sensor histidine kinase [Clostridium estertheticum]MBX4261631.1 PAS domain S-box protein [Clostridium estertheticum]WLC70320.1 PAS domain S-box protein [Clostridium estertheticum]